VVLIIVIASLLLFFLQFLLLGLRLEGASIIGERAGAAGTGEAGFGGSSGRAVDGVLVRY
jgi:hypothetical protein